MLSEFTLTEIETLKAKLPLDIQTFKDFHFILLHVARLGTCRRDASHDDCGGIIYSLCCHNIHSRIWCTPLAAVAPQCSAVTALRSIGAQIVKLLKHECVYYMLF